MKDLRASYRDIKLYAPEAYAAIDLSDNTNLWGTPPAAEATLRQFATSPLCRYPEPYTESLKDAISEYLGVPADHVATGAGSDDVLDAVFRAFGEPGDRVAFPAPSFVMVPTLALTNGLKPVPIPLTATYDADVDALLAERARIVYLCSPNNPTGTSLSRRAIETVVERAEGIVIVDEAYAEFAGASVVDLIRSSDRLIIVRTFSKAFGLAGLRVGYALAAPRLIAEIEKARGPYKVGALGAAAARAALLGDLPWMRERVALAIASRDRMRRELDARGIDTAPSTANFLFAPLAGASEVAVAMRTRGIAVRAFGGLPTFTGALVASQGSALRMTVGPWEMMETALAAFDDARDAPRRGASK